MMPAPRVSVISIFYNGEAYFAEAIESVLAQDMPDWELLLVDDGSQDGSTAIAAAYVERFPGRIRYLTHPNRCNRGMSATRNLGLSHAQAPFVAFIDADDRWHECKLREQLAIFEQHPRIAAVCGAVNYWRSWIGGQDVIVPTGHALDVVVDPPGASLALYPLGSAAAPCPSDIMLRKGIVERLGGFEEHFTNELQMYEDQGFLAKLYLAAPIYFSSSRWLDYRQHDSSIVAQVKQTGRYEHVRRYFLIWFHDYLLALDDVDPRVAEACRKALQRLDHPQRTRLMDNIMALGEKAKSVGRRALR